MGNIFFIRDKVNNSMAEQFEEPRTEKSDSKHSSLDQIQLKLPISRSTTVLKKKRESAT